MHKHRDLIIAWANGAIIQHRDDFGHWEDWDASNSPPWFDDDEYRIKPEPAPEPKKVTMYIYNNAHMGTTWIDDVHPKQRVDSIYSRYMGSIEVTK